MKITLDHYCKHCRAQHTVTVTVSMDKKAGGWQLDGIDEHNIKPDPSKLPEPIERAIAEALAFDILRA